MVPQARRCTSSREGKVMLSCWIPEELRMEFEMWWAWLWAGGRSA